jgi:hypothetical protein
MKQMQGLKFRRQQPIDNYIVDFVCFENRIIIEVDGGQHAAENNKDISHPPLNPLPSREGKNTQRKRLRMGKLLT